MHLVRSTGASALKEVLVDSSGQRPADAYIRDWARGQPLAIDVTVSHPSQERLSAGLPDGVQSASENASLIKADAKRRKYDRQCAERGVTFLPLVLCCYGGWLPDGVDLIQKLVQRKCARTGSDVAKISDNFCQQVSISLWRGNARQVLHSTA